MGYKTSSFSCFVFLSFILFADIASIPGYSARRLPGWMGDGVMGTWDHQRLSLPRAQLCSGMRPAPSSLCRGFCLHLTEEGALCGHLISQWKSGGIFLSFPGSQQPEWVLAAPVLSRKDPTIHQGQEGADGAACPLSSSRDH